MSYLRDLAGWALSGGAGENENNEENASNDNDEPMQQESEEEIRTKRLARLAERFNNTATESSNKSSESSPDKTVAIEKPSPMEIDDPKDMASNDDNKKPAAEASSKNKLLPSKGKESKFSKTSEMQKDTVKEPLAKKKRGKEASSKQDSVQKLQRKKEMLIKKILNISLTGGRVTSPECIEIDIGGEVVAEENIAEILALRLGIPASELRSASSKERNLIAYLGNCHKKAAEELKNSKSDTVAGNEEFLKEIKNQVVSFAASSLMAPDLFAAGEDGVAQLAECLVESTLDPAFSITLGVSGKNSSFYSCLCEELYSQDEPAFESVMKGVVSIISQTLKKSDSVMDGNVLAQVSALVSICSSKKAAVVITKVPNFLLPAAGSPKASEKISTPMAPPPPGATPQQQSIYRMMAAMSQGAQGYLGRSGPALEKETLLGLVMRLGTPMDNPSITSQFQSVASKSRSEVKKTTENLRRQLKAYQDSTYRLVKALITTGEEARKPVMQWFIDALLVNIGATALRPDKTKVSNQQTLQNISVVLLKLCEPFMEKPSRIDPGFVSSPTDHGGIFASNGDNAVPRLNDNNTPPSQPFNPKNKFIPLCFFLCARSLHLSVVASSGYHANNLVRQVNLMAWNLRQRNADVMGDRQFSHLLSMQFANEVSLLAPEMVTDSLRFFNLSAGFLLQVEDIFLPLMPEHMVEDMCSYVVFVSRFAGKDMAGVGLGNVFKSVVKLLSPKYATTVKNYNLRAKLGDVLHDVFLPVDKDSDIPRSVSCDPNAGGQPYLLSDPSALETLAPSLLLLYGEVELTGHYEKMSHRANISSLLQYLWEHKEHRTAFKRITQNKDSFIKFANGIINETNSLIASVMEKLSEIRQVQVLMVNTNEWNALSEEERETRSSRHEENESDVKRSLPLCNKTLKMLCFLSTDKDIRNLFLLDEMCPRMVNMLLHVMRKLVGARGMDLKVDNPESYDFRPKQMLTDLCSIFSCYANEEKFQDNCAMSGYYTEELMIKAVKTCSKLSLLKGKTMELFFSLPEKINSAMKNVEDDEALFVDAPDDFLDPLMCTFMKDPVLLPTSDTVIDRSTITQHLLNDPHDPFNRKDLSVDMIQPAVELKERMDKWLAEKREERTNKMQE